MNEEIYANVDFDKPACPIPAADHRGSSSSKKRVHVAVILSLGLLSVCLLAGIITLHVRYYISVETAAELLAIQVNLTERLQASNDKLSSLTEERNQLKANLSEITEELNKVQRLIPKSKTCPAGWRKFSCSCYLLSTTSGTWDAGRKDCRDRGADLVVIDDAEEQRFISGFTETASWIGLSDKETEGTWKWVDGTSPALTNWDTSQPDNGGGHIQWGEEDCVELRYYDRSLWNDVKCSASVQWICEKGPRYS